MTGRSTIGSRVARIGVGGLALVTLLGACGGGSSKSATTGPAASTTPKTGPVTHNVLLDSVRTTAAAKTAHVSMDVSTTGMGAAGFGVTADGAVDLTSGNSQITVHLNGPLAALMAGGIEVRSVDGTGYVQLPEGLGRMFGALGGGSGGAGAISAGKWIKVDISKFGKSSDPFGVGGQSDPTKLLAYLETVSDGVDRIGPDVIRGADATHYRASLDLGKAIDQAQVPPALRKELGELLQPGTKLPAIPVDVWIDGEGRVVRFQLHMDLGSFAAGLGGSGLFGSGPAGVSPAITVSMDLYDFGAPVDVQAPPPDEIVTFPGFGSLGQGLGSGLGNGPGGVGGTLGTVPAASST